MELYSVCTQKQTYEPGEYCAKLNDPDTRSKTPSDVALCTQLRAFQQNQKVEWWPPEPGVGS